MLSILLSAILSTQGAQWPLTRAERSNYRETSHYSDVVDFLQELRELGAPIRIESMGKGSADLDMPLVIASRPMMNAQMARRSGRPIIYIQANIHAGEVEGKEAVLALLRDWSRAKDSPLDHAAFVITPIYNIWGNEQFGPVEKNRPEQDGPELVGVRPNGQGFDLNRDCIKAESPEMRAVLRYVYQGWDPDVIMDLHTTDGTRHGFDLTYSPPLNPDTDPEIMRYTRDVLLPDVRKSALKKYGLKLFDYGNAERREERRDWFTFEPFGRYVTNYAGLRNRVSVLSEATTFIPFKDRIDGTKEFVSEVVGHVIRDSKKVTEMTRAADLRASQLGLTGSSTLGVKFDFASRGSETVPIEKLGLGEKPPLTGRPTAYDQLKMEIFDRFKITQAEPVPFAYAFPSSESEVAGLLQRHGVVVERVDASAPVRASVFQIGSAVEARQPFQGHKLLRLEGAFEDRTVRLDEGSFVVRSGQPLGNLIFTMLEPESLDGVSTWGFVKQPLAVGAPFPIVKLMKPVYLRLTRLPEP